MVDQVVVTQEDFDVLKRFIQGENPPELFDLLRDKFFNISSGAVVFHLERGGIIRVVNQNITIRPEKT